MRLTIWTTFNNYTNDKIHLKAINLIMIIRWIEILCTRWISRREYTYWRANLLFLAFTVWSRARECTHHAMPKFIPAHSRMNRKNATKLSMHWHYLQLRNSTVEFLFVISSSRLNLKQSNGVVISFIHETHYAQSIKIHKSDIFIHFCFVSFTRKEIVIYSDI